MLRITFFTLVTYLLSVGGIFIIGWMIGKSHPDEITHIALLGGGLGCIIVTWWFESECGYANLNSYILVIVMGIGISMVYGPFTGGIIGSLMSVWVAFYMYL